MNPDIVETLDAMLAEASASGASPAVHGFVTGSCCAPALPDAATLYEPLADHLAVRPDQLAAWLDMADWLANAEAALGSADLGFYPLLPEDDEDLASRTEAMGQWCAGFLAGYALGVGNNGHAPGVESQEILADFVAMTRIAPPEPGEDSEADFMELLEYLRMAAINLFLEARYPDAGPDHPLLSVH